MKLSDERLKEIRERCEKATPGPWEASYRGTLEVAEGSVHLPDDELLTPIIEDNNNVTIRGELRWEDADFTAHARTDIPALLEALEEARAELRELRERERWIPVSEKLPEPYRTVLIVGKLDEGTGDELTFRMCGFIRREGPWDSDEPLPLPKSLGARTVTHWRPLPLPPEEGK